jgi:hypothetical protein
VDVEDGDGVAELGAKTTEELDDELMVGDGRADIMKSVGKDLQLVAVLHDEMIILEHVMVLLLGIDNTLQLVVKEEVVDGNPAAIRRVQGTGDHVADVLGDGVVEPGDDGVINTHPLNVVGAVACVDGAVDVVQEAKNLQNCTMKSVFQVV